MTRTDLSQNALPAMRPAQDTLGGAGSGTDSPAPPPTPSSPSPVPTTHTRGAPSTDAPKTGQAIFRDMQDKLSAYFGNEIHLDDKELDIIIAMLNDADSGAKSPDSIPDSVTPHSLTGGCPTFVHYSPLPQSAQTHKGFHFGGYDGMTAIGIEGYWTLGHLEKTCEVLEQLKVEAGEEPDGNIAGCLGGHDILVSASGAREGGLLYRYRIVVDGVTILLHHNPPKGRQPVRVRFSAESLMVNTLPAVWQRVVAFFDSIGFVVIKAVPSRVDLQVTTDCLSMSDYVNLLEANHVVTKLRHKAIYGDMKGNVGTVKHGVAGQPVQITLYDKWKEMHSKGNCLTQKYMLNLQKMGDDWVNSDRSVTRVEISINRDGLRAMGINTVDDLFGNEWAVINLITHNWFRITAEPKKEGNEWKQKIHPLWDKIRSLFRRSFSDGDESDSAEWNKPKSVACDPVALEKQALGCLSKALALRHGEQYEKKASAYLANQWVASVDNDLHHKLNLTVLRVQVKTGIPLGKRKLIEDYVGFQKPDTGHNVRHTLPSDKDDGKTPDWVLDVFPDSNTPNPKTLLDLSPVRGSGESVELTGTTGRERFKESMDIINCNERFVPHDLDEYKLE